MKQKGFLLVVGVSLAFVFTFSACTLNLGNGEGDSSSSGENVSSPSGGGDGNPSSSSGGNSGGGSSSSGGTSGGAYSGEYGSLEYGEQTYKTVVIGDQTWMAENLNYEVDGSICYDNDDDNCEIYGRLYNWATAMNLSNGCNSTICSEYLQSNQGICPDGWHIPSNEDWDKLFRFVDGNEGTTSPYSSSTVGRYLKATSGWNSCGLPSDQGTSYLCEDTYGFAALPGGYTYAITPGWFTYYDVGRNGYWWSASEVSANYANSRKMNYNNANADNNDSSAKSRYFSIRCVKD